MTQSQSAPVASPASIIAAEKGAPAPGPEPEKKEVLNGIELSTIGDGIGLSAAERFAEELNVQYEADAKVALAGLNKNQKAHALAAVAKAAPKDMTRAFNAGLMRGLRAGWAKAAAAK